MPELPGKEDPFIMAAKKKIVAEVRRRAVSVKNSKPYKKMEAAAKSSAAKVKELKSPVNALPVLGGAVAGLALSQVVDDMVGADTVGGLPTGLALGLGVAGVALGTNLIPARFRWPALGVGFGLAAEDIADYTQRAISQLRARR